MATIKRSDRCGTLEDVTASASIYRKKKSRNQEILHAERG